MYEMNDGAFEELEVYTDQEGDFGGDFESFEAEAEHEFEAEGAFDSSDEGSDGDGEFETFSDDDEEMELAAELLAVGDDEELEQFLGKLIRRAAKGVRRFARSRAGRALRGHLRRGARRALPHIGRAIGGNRGARLATCAGNAFGLELEGLSPEDQELEMARRFVRFSRDATQRAVRMGSSAPPSAAARRALAAAARRHAPGLLTGSAAGRRTSGRWIRRGRRIVLLGV